jgi:hypothetical protein
MVSFLICSKSEALSKDFHFGMHSLLFRRKPEAFWRNGAAVALHVEQVWEQPKKVSLCNPRSPFRQ